MTEYRQLVIIGAGWQGIAAAKIYQDLYPKRDFLVVDANATIGGVWSTGNFYPQLKTQNTLGSFEYSWLPLSPEEFGVQPGSHIPGEVVQRYLQRVVERYDLTSRIRFNTKVISARPEGDGWLLQTECAAKAQTITCAKLIVATGITSVPRISKITGMKDFQGPVIGYKDLANIEKSASIEDPSIERLAVIGGSKAGHDAVYWNAIVGKKVDWVVRCSSSGIAWMTAASTRFLGQKRQVEAMACTRIFSFFSPCVWGGADGYRWSRWFLHQTRLGRLLVRLFWHVLGSSILAATGLHSAEETRRATPDFDFQWQASSAGTLNYDGDFYSCVRSGQVSIHRKTLSKLSYKKVHFSDGSHIQADALIYCAGWRWTSPIRFLGISSLKLGIPTRIDVSTDLQELETQRERTDARILDMFPYLRSAPPGPFRSDLNKLGADEDGEQYTSWCLHRAIAPPSQACEKSTKNLAFLGLFSTLPTAALCEIQALWAISFLHDQVKVPLTAGFAKDEAALWTRWDRLRYPFSHASKFMDTSYDIIPYFDVLLSDMQLRSRRKSSWWKELMEPYGSADYRGLIDEFKKRHN